MFVAWKIFWVFSEENKLVDWLLYFVIVTGIILWMYMISGGVLIENKK